MMSTLKLAEKYKEKLSKIKALAFDVDGILTDGKVWWAGDEVGWNRSFNIHDGFMLREMMKHGLTVGVITGGDSLSIDKRFTDNLKLDFVFKGSEDKNFAFNEIKKMGFLEDEILYMGDELFDIPILKKCGFSATAADAAFEVKEVVDYISCYHGGFGCAREVMDMVRYAKGLGD